MSNMKSLRDKYKVIARLLAERYGFPTWRQHLPPVDELIDTILSQNTSDINRDKAFDRLRARYPTWEQVRDAPTAEVIDLIRPAGLSLTKGPVIQSVLREITEQCGRINIDFLEDMTLTAQKPGSPTLTALAQRRRQSSYSSPSTSLLFQWIPMFIALRSAWD